MQRIKIPGGCESMKFTQENNMLIFEFEPKLKKGDIVKLVNDCTQFGIFDSLYNINDILFSTLININNGTYSTPIIGSEHLKYNISSIEELNTELAKNGYVWDSEKQCTVKLKWIPKQGEVYFYPSFIDSSFYIMTKNNDYASDIRLISRKLAFKTKEEAIAMAKKMLELC